MGAQATVSFGELLKEYRLAAGLTQEALAERAGVSARNIQNLERGENKPLKDTARRLAETLALAERERALLLTAVLPVPRRRTTVAAVPPLSEQAAPRQQDPAAPEAPLPGRMLAVLVADVRGYTAFTHAHGDEAGARLAARFASLAGEAVVAEDGRVVEVRGDEVLAVFTSARAALRAAAGILARCAEQASEALPLRAGVGLDVGEPVAVGDGYRGEVINTAARLCALAGPGEALASEAAVTLARRVDGLAYQDRGMLALKGIPRPVRAWLVRAGGLVRVAQDEEKDLPSEAPLVPEAAAPSAPMAIPDPRHNLPVALSSFIGREQERARVGELLVTHRLVTLVGSGGVGKTRLALAVAEDLRDSYPDGVWLVELAPLSDPALVPGAVAQVLGLREEPGRTLLQTLTGYLQKRQLLLLLDNCEHLIGACAELASALPRAAPVLRILATSREGLGVAGEQRYRVPSLSIPDPKHLPPSELAGSYEAVRLFVERAQERRDDFALTVANARAVAEICARLDGIPLAIELATARVGSMSVEAIAARLDQSIRLLTGGGRDLPSRQQTLRGALEWSWGLLEEGERTLLARLSVFAGGWTLDAAEAVCAAEELGAERPDGSDDVPYLGTWAVLDGLDSLVNRSLAQVDDTRERVPGEGVGRYRLLETVRQYAAERLAAIGEETTVRDRHLAWCVALAEEAEPALRGPEQRAWLARLEAEHDNLRAALAWGLGGAAEPALQLAGALWRFWYLHGHLSEGRRWLGAALTQDRATSAPATYQARALTGSGSMALSQGDHARARAVFEEALALQREHDDRPGIANTLANIGVVADREGDQAGARTLLEESLALRHELGDRWGIALCLGNLGALADREEDHARAWALQQEALALRRELGDVWGIAGSLTNLGVAAEQRKDFATARTLYQEALALRRELGDRQGIALCLHHLGAVADQQQDYVEARAMYGESLTLSRDLGDQLGVALALDALALVAGSLGQSRRAALLWGAGGALRQANGMPRPPREQATYEGTLAELGAALGEAACAAALREGGTLALDAAIALALADDPAE